MAVINPYSVDEKTLFIFIGNNLGTLIYTANTGIYSVRAPFIVDQTQSPEDQKAVIDALRRKGDASSLAIAQLMAENLGIKLS